MFEKIFEFLLSLIEDLKFWMVIPIWSQALRLRAGTHYDWKGNPYRIMTPGIWFKVPFFDQPDMHTVVTTVLNTDVQSLITKDGKQVAVKTIIKYNIKDITLFVTKIYDAKSALRDITQATVMRVINGYTYEECRDTLALSNEISIKVRAEVKKYGIDLEQITLTDFAETPSFRIFLDNCGDEL